MSICLDNQLEISVSFDISDREEGYDDDIRFELRQSGDKKMWLFPANSMSVLLTPEQAERLAAELVVAARASRNTPR